MIITDPNGKERWRLEGYLPKDEFGANLQMGRARVAVMDKDWSEAERRYAAVLTTYPDSKYAPEATYWHGVSVYQKTHEHEALSDVARTFTEKYRNSAWALRSIPWQHD